MCSACDEEKALKAKRTKEAVVAEQFKMPKAEYDWEVLMQTIDPKAFLCGVKPAPRPRRWSLNAISAVVGRDAREVLEEFKASKRVLGYYCPDVRCCVFYTTYLRDRMIDSSDSSPDGKGVSIEEQRVWKDVEKDLLQWDKGVRGFRRFKSPYGMQTPFDPEDKGDAAYQVLCEKALKEWHSLVDLSEAA